MDKDQIRANEVLNEMRKIFPDAHCELNYETTFQLCVAVILSAQTTDIAVNKITIALFDKYPTSKEMAQASLSNIEFYIHHLGLFHNKAQHLKQLSIDLEEKYQGIVPSEMEKLLELPGIGRKSANVIRSVCFNIPSFAVDTHVNRISKRLGFNKGSDSVLEVEQKITSLLDESDWIQAHHLFIFFGRYLCTSQKPKCKDCPFPQYCNNKVKNV